MDYLCIYLCESCGKYYTIGAHRRTMRCPRCDSKEREHISSISPSVIIERLLNEDVEKLIADLKEFETP